MKPRRWIVRHYGISLISLGTPRLLLERSFRWHWLARLDCWLTNQGPFGHWSLFYATVEQARPQLTVITGGRADVPKLNVGRTL